MKPRLLALFLFLTVSLTSRFAQAAEPQLWVYCQTNLLVDRNVANLDALWKRAHAAGYTHVLLADSKFCRLDMLGSNAAHYTENLQKIRQIAAQHQMTLIPALFPVGYSNDLLGHDVNLAEGLPVRDTPFVVNGGIATVAADPALVLSKMVFHDDTVHLDGGVATINTCQGNARFVYHLNLPKYRCYHVSVMVKTNDFHGDAHINPVSDNTSLNNANLGAKPTQDWTQTHGVFDTLEHTDVNLYFGVWGGCRGTLQWKDWKIEEVGLVNVLRRDGAPCVVKRGDRTLVEGKDFDKIADPNLGMHPWEGEYDIWHQPPVVRTHGLPDGTKLAVSWYFPPIVNEGQVNMCISEPESKKLLADQARLVKSAFNAPGYMMSHDEIRCMNWDESCQKRNIDAGPMLAENVRYCINLLQPATVYTWSDMFDPFHNAHDHYYFVRGNLAGSWNGLDKNVIIFNWNFGHRDESLKFFQDRGNRQIIAGYYDGDLSDMKLWLASAAKSHSVIGMMYTTWARDYSQLEAFAALCKQGR